MEKDELRRLWEDEQHWGRGSFGGNFCKQDPRLFVPKRRLPGGTLNLAHAGTAHSDWHYGATGITSATDAVICGYPGT